jgi:hypothetical protein
MQVVLGNCSMHMVGNDDLKSGDSVYEQQHRKVKTLLAGNHDSVTRKPQPRQEHLLSCTFKESPPITFEWEFRRPSLSYAVVYTNATWSSTSSCYG